MKSSSPVISELLPQDDSSAVNRHRFQEIFEKLFSMREVSQHCDPSSIWVVIDNVVYDITQFLCEHPGGQDILLEHAGRDCTVSFQDKGHSKLAVKLLQKYRIGMLQLSERISM